MLRVNRVVPRSIAPGFSRGLLFSHKGSRLLTKVVRVKEARTARDWRNEG